MSTFGSTSEDKVSSIAILLRTTGLLVLLWLSRIIFQKFSEVWNKNKLLGQLPLLVAGNQEILATTHKGYLQFLKHGKPYLLRCTAEGINDRIMLPLKYMDEVKDASEDDLSFLLFSNMILAADHTSAPTQTLATTHLFKVSLARHLSSLVPEMHRIISSTIREKLSQSKNWEQVPLYPMFVYIAAKNGAFVLGAPEMSENEEWLQASINVTRAAFAAGSSLRKQFPPWTWPLTSFFDSPTRQIRSLRRRAADMISPIYKRYLSAAAKDKASISTSSTGMLWYAATTSKDVSQLSAQEVADDQLFLAMAAVHTTSASLLNTVCDLVDLPREIIDDLRQEIKSNIDQDNDVRWTMARLSKLVKLDSFMKESQRMNTIGLHTMARATKRQYIFKDGFTVPAGVIVQMPNHELNMDSDNHTNPGVFDAYRFVNRPQGNSFTSISPDTSINFGAGIHTCPGRGMAGAVMKLVLCELLLHYDVKFDDSGSPPLITSGTMRLRNPTMNMIVRRT